MEQASILQWAWDTLDPEIASQGYELVEVEYELRGSTVVFRLFVDKAEGITLDNCAELSRYLSAFLDLNDVLSSKYMLEISSPGIERPVRKVADFIRFAGERVKVQTVTPIEGRKRFTGTLSGYDDGLISLKGDDATFSIHIENVKKARLDR